MTTEHDPRDSQGLVNRLRFAALYITSTETTRLIDEAAARVVHLEYLLKWHGSDVPMPKDGTSILLLNKDSFTSVRFQDGEWFNEGTDRFLSEGQVKRCMNKNTLWQYLSPLPDAPPDYKSNTADKWQKEVAGGITLLGYREWVQYQTDFPE